VSAVRKNKNYPEEPVFLFGFMLVVFISFLSAVYGLQSKENGFRCYAWLQTELCGNFFHTAESD